MVFDWFRRAAADAETTPQADPAAAAAAAEEQLVAPEVASQPAASPESGDVEAAAGLPPAVAVPQVETLQAAAPPEVGVIDQAALDWARQAYARLKAQQEGQQSAAAAQEAPLPSQAAGSSGVSAQPEAVADAGTASEAAPVAAESLAEGLPVPSLEQEVPAEATAAPVQTAAPDPAALAAVDQPLELSPAASDAAEAPVATPGASLLERAAAQRQQRLQELSAPPAAEASVPSPAPVDAPLPTTTPVAEEASEPTLGAFDDTFTWSAEVLAAQGRRVEEISLEEIDWLGRLRQGLEKTRRNFVSQLLENLGDDPLTPEVLDDLETTLLRADVGVTATDQVLEALRRRLNQEVVDPAEGLRFLKQQLRDLLEAPIKHSEVPLLAPQRGRLNIWLMVGVNGVGKTTTLGKLANLAVRSGYSCLIAAADTFRAAAVQQVQVWGERSGVPVVSNPSSNADPAAVVYDAIGAARAKGTELVLVDTAGRLQTKHNLMEELSKVRRIIDRLAPEAVVESLLVLDASQGQNGLRQALAFASAASLTGVVITKLDGSARGGVALAVASEAGLPIRFIGAGEGIRDLRPFNSFEFVEALLAGSR